ncbi:MAG TPA: hypothetical protein VIG45_06750 [Erysipelothrix sp.]
MANFALRLDQSTKDQLHEIAKADKRSLNKLIEFILEDYVDNYKAEKRKNQKRVRVNLEDI